MLHEPSGNGELKADTIDGRQFSTQKAFTTLTFLCVIMAAFCIRDGAFDFWVSFLSLRLGHPFRSYDTSAPSSLRPLFSSCRVYIHRVFVLEGL